MIEKWYMLHLAANIPNAFAIFCEAKKMKKNSRFRKYGWQENLKLKIYSDSHLIMRASEWFFHPTNFRKQDYFLAWLSWHVSIGSEAFFVLQKFDQGNTS